MQKAKCKHRFKTHVYHFYISILLGHAMQRNLPKLLPKQNWNSAAEPESWKSDRVLEEAERLQHSSGRAVSRTRKSAKKKSPTGQPILLYKDNRFANMQNLQQCGDGAGADDHYLEWMNSQTFSHFPMAPAPCCRESLCCGNSCTRTRYPKRTVLSKQAWIKFRFFKKHRNAWFSKE